MFVTLSVSEESLSNSYGNVQYSKRSFALLRMTNELYRLLYPTD